MKKTLIILIILLIAIGFYFVSRDSTVDVSNSPLETEQIVQEQTQNIVIDKPILYNLGIDIESLDKSTNKAGDIIFSKQLIYDDGRVAGDKAFIDFGSKEKYFEDSIGTIEYWFHVPLKTSVKSPLTGRAEVIYFEHTEDWGVNILTEFDYIISFEHLVNLNVEDGSIVNVGDVLGEAAPRNTFGDKIAMVELAVWMGGNNVVKFCPFDFLDESLKQPYAQKINTLSTEWEDFIDEDVYEQEKWVSPGCLVDKIIEN